MCKRRYSHKTNNNIISGVFPFPASVVPITRNHRQNERKVHTRRVRMCSLLQYRDSVLYSEWPESSVVPRENTPTKSPLRYPLQKTIHEKKCTFRYYTNDIIVWTNHSFGDSEWWVSRLIVILWWSYLRCF